MKSLSHLLKSPFILFFLISSFRAIWAEPPTSMSHTTTAVPELPGGSLYLLLGGALIWIRSFFKR
jgi:hypothetical protein